MTPSQTHKPIILLAAWLLALSMMAAMLAALSGKQTVQAAPAGGTNVSGTIITHTTWTVVGSPYVITDYLTINPGITLTIEPGVMILDGDQSLYKPEVVIEGHLQAIGTPQQPITFTSLNSGPAEWNGLVFYQGGGHLEYVKIQHADGAVCTESYLSGYQVAIKNSILENNNVGICNSYALTDSQIVLENVTIRNNDWYAITSHPSSLPYLQMNNIILEGNAYDRIAIELYDDLTQNIILSSYPGLEAYEIIQGTQDEFVIPTSVTLTVEPGVTVMTNEQISFRVEGFLQAQGTTTTPITFTSSLNSGSGEWTGIQFEGDGGGGHLANTTIRYADVGLFIFSLDPSAVIVVEDSQLEANSGYPLGISMPVLHQLMLNNVVFENNNKNRVAIFDSNQLAENVILAAQPGLEGYEILGANDGFSIPAGITLTLQPGVTMMFPGEFDVLAVNGRLQTLGTITQPVTLMASPQNSAGKWTAVYVDGGDVEMTNTIIMSAEVGVYVYSLDPGANVHIADSTFRGNVSGVFVETADPTANILIEDSLMVDNSGYAMGLKLDLLHQVELSNLSFSGNSPDRIFFENDVGDAEIDSDVILKAHNGLDGYEVDGSVDGGGLIIPTGMTLTMEGGTTLFVPDSLAVAVDGTIQALGTTTMPVTLTSINDSSAGDGWGGLYIGWSTTDGTASLEHTILRYGEYSNITVNGSNSIATLDHSDVSLAHEDGLVVVDGAVTAVCSTFTQNQNDGIHILNGNNPNTTIFNSNINDNGGAGLNNENGVLVDARYNWWGDASGPGGIGPGSGDEISGTVNYEPWLTEPPATCFTSVPTAAFQTSHLTVTEGAATAVLTITLNSAPEITATVHVSTSANTAQPFQDFTPVSTTLTFPPGQTIQTITVAILDDSQVEVTESLTVTLAAVANVALGVPATAVITISDDDTKPVIPVLSFVADTITVTEGMATAVLTLTLNAAPELTVTVDYETVADTAVPHSDYLPISGTLTFAPGSTTQVVTIPLLDDNSVESDEMFSFVLSSPVNITLANDTMTIVIRDDDVADTTVIYLPFITTP